MIAYVVDKSAIKVGAGNVNEMDAWYGNTELRYITMRTRYLGVQMNAEHELEDSDVTEMTQMISALSQNGYYSDVVNEIYTDIGAVVAEALAEFKASIGDSNKIYKLLGKAFIDSFKNNDRDTIGLAQAFVLKATEALKSENPEYRIPFSAETVSGLFISTVSSMITKKGIRRKYDGFAGVLTPAFNQIQYYNVGGKPYLYEKFTRLIHQMGIKGYTDEFGIKHSAIKVAMNDYRLQDGSLNPFLKPISQNEIDFEDTIVLRYINENGEEVFEERYVREYAEYAALKHNQLPENVEIFVFESRPKNLKDIDTKFDIEGVSHSLYDLDSVRASFYVRNLANLNDEQRFILKQFISEEVLKDPENALKTIRKRIQSDLRALDKGKPIMLNGQLVTAENVRIIPGQAVSGRYHAKPFMLEDGDSISDVKEQGAAFFEAKLRAKYTMDNEEPFCP